MTLRRITYVLNVFPKLSETFIALELEELVRRGIDLQILSLRRPPEAVQHEFVKQAGLVDITSYDPVIFPELLRSFRPQLIHAHFATEPTAMAWQFADEFNVPFTFTAHGYDIYRRPPDDFAVRAASARAVITVSEANARYIDGTLGVPRDRIHVIPCGIDTNRFFPNGGPIDPPLIVCVARLVPVKNLALLLEACAQLRAHNVQFRCQLVGDGPCLAELKALRQRYKLDDLVSFYGPADQVVVRRWWQQAAVGVLTSEREGMPISLMEAAACGVPVVATAVGGVPELVKHNLTGLLSQPGDVLSLTDALERLLSESLLRTRMGRAARQHALRHFTVQRQVNRLLGVWREVVHEAKQTGIARAT